MCLIDELHSEKLLAVPEPIRPGVCAGGYSWTGAQDPTLLNVLKCELLFIGATENVRGTL